MIHSVSNINLFYKKTNYNIYCFIRKQFYIPLSYIYMEGSKLAFRKVISEWLKENADKIMKTYTIDTSEVTYIELMLLAKRYDLDFIEINKSIT